MSYRTRTRISLEGWYYLFIVVFIIGGAVLGEVNLLVALAGMMIGPFLFNWRFVQLSLRDLSVARRVPPRVHAGDVVTATITAVNDRRRLSSWTVTVEDRLRRQGEEQAGEDRRVRVMIPRVDVGESCSVQYRTRLSRRGRYVFGPLRVETRFPLGLVGCATRIDQPATLLVYPQMGHLAPRWLNIVNTRFAGSQSEGRRQGMMEGDYYGLREWRTGDSQRWIHWRTSARLGELTVRQFEQQQSRDLALVLDLWQADSPTEQEQATTELAISFMATAVADLCRQGGRHLTLCVAGRQPRYWSGPAAGMLAREVLDHLAEVAPGDGLKIYEVLDHVGRRATAGKAKLVLSTRGAPFLTGEDDWATPGRFHSTATAHGRVTWIDCRSDMLWKYFVPA